MGPVERVLVLGIVVVIVAILGIAVWGAAGDGDDGLPQDGGVLVDAGGTAVETPLGSFDLNDSAVPGAADGAGAGPAPGQELMYLQQMREAREARLALAKGEGGAVPADGGGAASPLTTSGGLESPAGTVPVALSAPEPIAPAAATAPVTAAPAAASVPSGPRGGTTHVVSSGDSLWKIARRAYGDGNVQEHIDAILSENPALDEDSVLVVGMRIKLPVLDARGDIVRLPADRAADAIDGQTYKVRAGDTLSMIAQRELGAASRWQEIYELNRARITDPGRIVEGMLLALPARN